MIEVFSCGGGTQSAAITALIVRGDLPKPDHVVIADTGREMPSTWEYWDNVIVPALKPVGISAERIPWTFQTHHNPNDGKYAPMFNSDNWTSLNGNTVLLPAYTTYAGIPGKMPGFCSGYWKRDVVDKYMLHVYGLSRKDWKKWVGFSFDETSRVEKIMDSQDYKNGLVRLPLVHDYTLHRDSAIRLVKDMGWPDPPRSRCYMCPQQSDYEWREVKYKYPREFESAVGLESEIKMRDPHVWLHQSCKPLASVEFEEEDFFSQGCTKGECFT